MVAPTLPHNIHGKTQENIRIKNVQIYSDLWFRFKIMEKKYLAVLVVHVVNILI